MPILDGHTLDLISHSPAQTRRFGARLGGLLQAGDLVCLEGGLGTGKTCLVQGIGRGMGVAEPITSPSFTLIAEDRPSQISSAETAAHGEPGGSAAPVLYHVDLYRLQTAVEEARGFGLEDYFLSEGVCVIEWAERAEPILPQERLWVALRYVDQSKRGLMIRATGARYDELLQKFRLSAFGV
jgi:tRNA threonylcarbamoyladenosine biosynthesis protein TsaE